MACSRAPLFEQQHTEMKEAVMRRPLESGGWRLLEVIVHANADDIVLGAAGNRYAEQRHRRVARIDVKIFNLGTPIRRKHPFDAAAERPSCLR